MSLLHVSVLRAEGLKSGLIDKSDPYAKVKFADNHVQPREARTHTIENNASPVWNSKFCFLVPNDISAFEVEIMDEDVGRDDSLGSVHLVVGKLGERKTDRYGISKKGQLHCSFAKLPLSGLFS